MSLTRTFGSCTVILAAAALGAASPRHAAACRVPPPKQRVVELALCLDTSGSMTGLIDSARQKLWAIVNEIGRVEPAPALRVALLTFGNNGHDPQAGWVRIESPFTGDLDFISGKLFALTTNGGTEYVGRVLQSAGGLDWSPADDALKLIVVAGNESADQDSAVPFRQMCKALVTRGIMVNSIYCGPLGDGISPAWEEVARLADGQFAAIDQDSGTLVIATPYDDRLTELSTAINSTYVPLGAAGLEGLANQAIQDDNARNQNGAAAASRAQTKGQGLYMCSWDLVDACRAGGVKLQDVKADDLPENMRSMTAEDCQAYVDAMDHKRADLRAQIDAISAEREAFIAAEMKNRAIDDTKAFDNAVRRAVREQAESKGFVFPAKDDC